MEKSQGHGDAKGKVSCIPEEAKTKMAAAEGTEVRFGAKRGGVMPAKRRLVKRMMWDGVVNWVGSALRSCCCSSATWSGPVPAKKKTAGVPKSLFCPESIGVADETKDCFC